MCLVVFSVNQHPDYPLIIAANRDEFFERPTEAVHHWQDNPNIIAGRDLVAGGTWLGITKTGRFSAVTNIRQFPNQPKELSRGQLITDFLESDKNPDEFAENLSLTAKQYSGFNLFMGTIKASKQDNHCTINLSYANNHNYQPESIGQGVHGISNGQLSDNWRKVTHTQQRFLDAIGKPFEREDLLQVLRHNEKLQNDELPETGASLSFEQQLSSAFIPSFELLGNSYGTRSQALITVNNDLKADFYEIQLNAQQKVVSEKQFTFKIES